MIILPPPPPPRSKRVEFFSDSAYNQIWLDYQKRLLMITPQCNQFKARASILSGQLCLAPHLCPDCSVLEVAYDQPQVTILFQLS